MLNASAHGSGLPTQEEDNVDKTMSCVHAPQYEAAREVEDINKGHVQNKKSLQDRECHQRIRE